LGGEGDEEDTIKLAPMRRSAAEEEAAEEGRRRGLK